MESREQESIDISDTDNLEILSNRLSNISSRLLVRSLKNIKLTDGLNKSDRLKYLNAIDQSEINCNPTYARQITKKDYLINWNLMAIKIIKIIQGLYPNAYTLHNGKRVKILEACKASNLIDFNRINKLTPGEVIKVDQENGILIMAQDYPITIKYGQLEGKNRTDGYTLSLQANIKIQNIMGN